MRKMSSVGLLKLVVLQWLVSRLSLGGTHYYDFVVETANYTRLCSTKQILTVNRQFPGPTLYARRGDTMVVKVCNLAAYNVTIHWHGVKMPRNPWSDGPAYITQCPIKPGGSFSYIINLSDEEGTLWWHAHTDWIRATVHGAIVVYPKLGDCYPFPKPHREFLVILGEWWKKDVKEMYNETRGGLEPEPSDAYTINGQPGDLYPCSKTETFTMQLEEGNIYLLRTINAGLTNAMFVSIARHEITMVGSDGSYIKPITTQYIMISPGETMDLLIQADQNPNSLYYLASRALNYEDLKHFDTTTATAIVTYRPYNSTANSTQSPLFPSLPSYDDTASATGFMGRLRSLQPPTDIPRLIGRQFLIAVALNKIDDKFAASLNNISFNPSTSIDILEAYYYRVTSAFGVNFPDEPPHYYNFTADVQPKDVLVPTVGREVQFLEFGVGVEIVFQGTSVVMPEDHPMHLHGLSFYVVGLGFGNFDKERDPFAYNLVDPPLKNTISVPKNGWVAVRFRANNPGVWYLHCHVESHLAWGMSTVLIVKDGPTPDSQMLHPPRYMPPC